MSTQEGRNSTAEDAKEPIDELLEFKNSLTKIINKVTAFSCAFIEEAELRKTLQKCMTTLLEENLKGGKMLRGLMVSMTYKSLVSDPSDEDIERAHALGWVIEIIQAACLIADDIMDHSETRRGEPCWYKREEVGYSAVNDVHVVEMAAFHVLEIYFKDFPCYRAMYDLLHNIIYLTAAGQTLDVLTEKSDNILKSYTMSRYEALVTYKTGYYTVYAPIALGMIYAGKGEDADIMRRVERLSLRIGHYFQVQDDYLDCFGDPKKTGKVGTDIQDNKCTWLFVTALQLANKEQLEALLDNYGKADQIHVNAVKRIYKDLELEQKYREYEEEILEEVKDMAFALTEDNEKEAESTGMNAFVFFDLLERLHKRSS